MRRCTRPSGRASTASRWPATTTGVEAAADGAGRRASKAAEDALLRGEPGACAERSEEHTSELQSLMRISYAVFRLKKKNRTHSQKDRRHKQKMSELQSRRRQSYEAVCSKQ